VASEIRPDTDKSPRPRLACFVWIYVDAVSRSLGTRRWRYAVDPPESIPPADVRHASAIGAVATADELAALFMAAAPQGNLPTDLGAKLVALCQAAHHQYPAFAIDDRELVTAIGARAPTITIDAVDAYLARCQPGDLALALMASRGEPAFAELERGHRLTIDSTCRRFASAAHTADDLKQILRERLLAGKLADYAGQGLLDHWLRVTAVRIFLDLTKRTDRSLPLDDLGLEPGDRHLLRQHLVMRLSIDQLGAVLGVPCATIAARIKRARERLQLDGRALRDVIGLPR
jgi:DNA-directed RNA polymerase specialized sigma24 family protein